MEKKTLRISVHDRSNNDKLLSDGLDPREKKIVPYKFGFHKTYLKIRGEKRPHMHSVDMTLPYDVGGETGSLVIRITPSYTLENWCKEFDTILMIYSDLLHGLTPDTLKMMRGEWKGDTFEIGYFNNDRDHASSSLEEEWIDKYKGWPNILFERGVDELDQFERMRKNLEAKHIYSDIGWDCPRLRIFFEEMTLKNVLRAHKCYAMLRRENQRQCKIMLKASFQDLMKRKPWKSIPR